MWRNIADRWVSFPGCWYLRIWDSHHSAESLTPPLTRLSQCWESTEFQFLTPLIRIIISNFIYRETETPGIVIHPFFPLAVTLLTRRIWSNFLIPFYPISPGHYRRAVRLAPQVACPWQGYDPAPSPTGPTSTPRPPAPLPPPPPPHIARPSAVPPPTTGSDDTVTSVSLFSNFLDWISLIS